MHHAIKIMALSLVAMGTQVVSAAPSAVAGSGEGCAQLQEQFHKEVALRPHSVQRREARYFGNEGQSWCETGYAHRGAEDYKHALQILTEPASS